MDMAAYLRFVAALIVVLGLIMAAAWAMRRYGFQMGRSLAGTGRGARRLSVVETLGLDPKRRLMLVRCDGREHLLLLGPGGDLVIDGAERAATASFPDMLADDAGPPPQGDGGPS